MCAYIVLNQICGIVRGAIVNDDNFILWLIRLGKGRADGLDCLDDVPLFVVAGNKNRNVDRALACRRNDACRRVKFGSGGRHDDFRREWAWCARGPVLPVEPSRTATCCRAKPRYVYFTAFLATNSLNALNSWFSQFGKLKYSSNRITVPGTIRLDKRLRIVCVELYRSQSMCRKATGPLLSFSQGGSESSNHPRCRRTLSGTRGSLPRTSNVLRPRLKPPQASGSPSKLSKPWMTRLLRRDAIKRMVPPV